MYHYTYLITNLSPTISEKYYIGVHSGDIRPDKEEKKNDFVDRSKAQKKSKNNRSRDEIKATVEKRLATYKKMDKQRQLEIGNSISKAAAGQKWYNNGKITKMFFPDKVPPEFSIGGKLHD